MTSRSPDDGRRMALEFLESAAKKRISALGSEQARQEALLLSVLRAELGVGAPTRPDGDNG